MIHDRVSIDEWKSRFPAATIRERGYNHTVTLPAITSPLQFVAFEHLRDKQLRKSGLESKRLRRTKGTSKGQPVPADVFLLNLGEPARREVTKIGGLPYWPASRTWPTAKCGEPRTFVAQFCFADSHEITSELPGDVLLMFAAGQFGEDWYPEDDLGLRFEWLMLGHTDLVSQQDIPDTKWKITPCYGSLYRTIDYPGWLLSLPATKIGGHPAWKQGDEDASGRFLCQLASIDPSAGPYPFLNVPEERDEGESDNFLMWVDVGCFYFFIDRRGQIEWRMQC